MTVLVCMAIGNWRDTGGGLSTTMVLPDLALFVELTIYTRSVLANIARVFGGLSVQCGGDGGENMPERKQQISN